MSGDNNKAIWVVRIVCHLMFWSGVVVSWYWGGFWLGVVYFAGALFAWLGGAVEMAIYQRAYFCWIHDKINDTLLLLEGIPTSRNGAEESEKSTNE